MKVEVIKEELQEIYSGDILSITNGHEHYTYLLFEDTDKSIGAIDMDNGYAEVKMSNNNEFLDVIRVLEERLLATEYKVFSNDKVKLILGK